MHSLHIMKLNLKQHGHVILSSSLLYPYFFISSISHLNFLCLWKNHIRSFFFLERIFFTNLFAKHQSKRGFGAHLQCGQQIQKEDQSNMLLLLLFKSTNKTQLRRLQKRKKTTEGKNSEDYRREKLKLLHSNSSNETDCSYFCKIAQVAAKQM